MPLDTSLDAAAGITNNLRNTLGSSSQKPDYSKHTEGYNGGKKRKTKKSKKTKGGRKSKKSKTSKKSKK